jgi:hypothetical protein
VKFLHLVLWFHVLLLPLKGEPVKVGEDNVTFTPLVVASQPECMSGFCWSFEDKPDWSQVIDLRSKP